MGSMGGSADVIALTTFLASVIAVIEWC